MKQNTFEEIIDYTIYELEQLQDTNIEADEVHNILFNQDYYIIGTNKAERWLEKNGGIFYIIREVQEYEKWQFGEVMTDVTDPEKLVNMYFYMLGEEILHSTSLHEKYWNKKLDNEMLLEISNEVRNLSISDLAIINN